MQATMRVSRAVPCQAGVFREVGEAKIRTMWWSRTSWPLYVVLVARNMKKC